VLSDLTIDGPSPIFTDVENAGQEAVEVAAVADDHSPAPSLPGFAPT
jgi:hypothetical protein